MRYSEFSALISPPQPAVVLLEGTRELPPEQAHTLTELAARLAREFPHVRFRTGNARGSDEAFAAGVAEVDPARLEYVLPYEGHRRGNRPEESAATALGDLPSSRVQELIDTTLTASPKYARVAVNYRDLRAPPRQKASAQLILRDTLKVIGTPEMPPPAAGIFFVNAADPDRGGTGHTMRVCRSLGVPVITQFEWTLWFAS